MDRERKIVSAGAGGDMLSQRERERQLNGVRFRGAQMVAGMLLDN